MVLYLANFVTPQKIIPNVTPDKFCNMKNYFWGVTQSTEFCLVEISPLLSHFRTNIAHAPINHVIFVLFRCIQCDGDIISHFFGVKISKNKINLLFKPGKICNTPKNNFHIPNKNPHTYSTSHWQC